MREFSIQFVTRTGCHLCDQAEPVVRAVAGRLGVAVKILDIDSDDDLIRRYSLRVPVVLDADGAVVAEGLIDRRTLGRALRRLRRGWPDR